MRLRAGHDTCDDAGPIRGIGPVKRATRLGALIAALLAFEVVNASYLAAFDSATIFYHAQVVAHLVAGILLAVLLVAGAGPALLRGLRAPGRLPLRALQAIAGLAALIAVGTALRLADTGTASPFRALLWIHIVASVFALA